MKSGGGGLIYENGVLVGENLIHQMSGSLSPSPEEEQHLPNPCPNRLMTSDENDLHPQLQQNQQQFTNTAVVMVEKDVVVEPQQLLPLATNPDECDNSLNSNPHVIISRNSFNNLIKLDIRPIEVVAAAPPPPPPPVPASSSSPLPPPPPTPPPPSCQIITHALPGTNLIGGGRSSMIARRFFAGNGYDEHCLAPIANALIDSRCQLRRNSSFPNKSSAFSRRASCMISSSNNGLSGGGGVGHRVMNGTLQYHDVKTKIQQFEKIRTEASSHATTLSNTMSSSSVI